MIDSIVIDRIHELFFLHSFFVLSHRPMQFAAFIKEHLLIDILYLFTPLEPCRSSVRLFPVPILRDSNSLPPLYLPLTRASSTSTTADLHSLRATLSASPAAHAVHPRQSCPPRAPPTRHDQPIRSPRPPSARHRQRARRQPSYRARARGSLRTPS